MTTLTISDVLLQYEVPLVVLAKDVKDKSFVGVNYADGDDACLFYFARIKEEDLNRLLQQRIDVRYLVTKKRVGQFYLGESWGTAGLQVQTKAQKEISAEMLPQAGMFIPQHSAYAVTSELKTVNIDGRWGIDDLRRFSDLVQDCYAFVYALTGQGAATTKQRISGLFHRYPWRGGFSAVNFFDDLYRMIPSSEQASIREIQYASPGKIVLRMNDDVAGQIHQFVTALDSEDSTAKQAYMDARVWLKKREWLGRAKDDLELTSDDLADLTGQVRLLCEKFGLGRHSDQIMTLAKSDPLGAVKILLAYYRRLSGLADYVSTGKAHGLFA